jgi:signal transduction histidine kinase
MKSLKRKLAFSYGLLILIIFAVSVWSVYHVGNLGQTAGSTKEALEHQDPAAVLAAIEHVITASRHAEISIIVAGVLALALALLFAWRFAKYVADPISTLTDKARRIGEGDLDQRIEISSEDELGALAEEFNRMTARLRDLRRSDYGQMLVERKKSDAVIDSIYEPVIVTDARGHVTKINTAARQLFHNGNETDNDISLSGVTGGGRILSAIQSAVTMQRPVAVEGKAALVPIKAGGTERSFRVRATPMRDAEGRMLGAVTVLEDITSMTELDKLKTEFISVASGKLREPLHTLQLALHAVIEGYTGELSDQQIDMLQSARQNAEKLEELMNDLLELAEIESGTLRFSTERLRPIDLARAAIEKFRLAAECRHIRLEANVWPDLSWVVADRRAVARIFDNLLSNALRHTPRDGSVTIEASEQCGRVFFSVRDTGEGIPEEFLPDLFGRFVRIGDKPGGTGLGLALVKRLVEAQGGQVRVESQPGEGTTFTFTLIEGGPSSVRTMTGDAMRKAR